MKYKRLCSRVTALLLMVMLLAAMLPCALADDAAQEETGTINYIYETNNQPIVGVNIRLYKVGDENGNLTVSQELADKCYTDGKLDANKTVSVLTAYYEEAANKAGCIQTGVTKEDGTWQFENLENGYYLIIGDRTVDAASGAWYWPQSILVTVPYQDQEASEPSAYVTVHPKPLDDIKVVKKWANDTASNRPTSITVVLTDSLGGTVEQVITPDEKGNWSYTWDNLNPNISYTINEKSVPTGYTATVSGNTITNTYKTSGGTLPKTGLVWWPVVVLLLAGILCITVGVMSRRRDR